MSKTRARINHLEQMDEILALFAIVVRSLAKTFKLEKMCDPVKFYVEEGYGA